MVVSVIFISMISLALIPKMYMNSIVSNFKTETSHEYSYVYFDTVYLGDKKIKISEILLELDENYRFMEAYFLKNECVYFSFLDFGNRKEHPLICIAKISINEMDYEILYTTEVQSIYEENEILDNASHDFSKKSPYENISYFYNGKIIIKDTDRIVQYDVDTEEISICSANEFVAPICTISVQIIDNKTIIFADDLKTQIIDSQKNNGDGDVFSDVLSLKNQKIWNNVSVTEEIFSQVQLVNGEIVIVCRVLNWLGESTALFFEYDFENNKCKYIDYCYTGDVFYDDLYLISVIE